MSPVGRSLGCYLPGQSWAEDLTEIIASLGEPWGMTDSCGGCFYPGAPLRPPPPGHCDISLSDLSVCMLLFSCSSTSVCLSVLSACAF
eukprot:3289367-Karenia_brevis.AAC.1